MYVLVVQTPLWDKNWVVKGSVLESGNTTTWETCPGCNNALDRTMLIYLSKICFKSICFFNFPFGKLLSSSDPFYAIWN